MKGLIRSKSQLIAAVAGVSLFALHSQAAPYTYSESTSTTTQWSDGNTGGSWDATPVSDPSTVLLFGNGQALASGVNVVSNNDIGNPGDNFVLNKLTASYIGPGSGVAPTVTISGNPLKFVDDGATNPVLAVTSNRSASTATSFKPNITISNDLVIGSTLFTASATSTASGGPNTVDLTGGLSYSTSGAHTLAFSGNLGTGTVAAAINDASLGNATSVTKSGTSTWVLNGGNGYTGGTSVSGGILQSTVSEGFGSGLVTVTAGQAYATGATYSNEWSLGGGSIRLGATTLSNTITLTADSQIVFPSSNTTAPLISGQITGDGGVTFVGIAGVTATLHLTNTLNNYTGDTQFTLSTTSGRDSILSLEPSVDGGEVIPNGAGHGNLVFSATSEAGVLLLQMNGKDETINGLSSIVPGQAGSASVHRIRNGTAAATLTVGDNNADGNFVGTIDDGTNSTRLSLTKVGSGTQVFSGSATHDGATTISGGKLEIDYAVFGTSMTAAPADYFSATSDMTLAGGTTFAIKGRGDGGAIHQESVALGTGGAGRSFTLSNDLADQLVVGQELVFQKTSGSGNLNSGTNYVTAITRGATNSTVYAQRRMTSAALTATLDTSATDGTTSQTLKSLTLSGLSGENANFDFGTSGDVVLTILNPPIQDHDGSTLTIANWDGVAGESNVDSNRLIFVGEPTDFSSVFNQNEIIFTGYGPGYELKDLGTSYEVVATAVPEPTSMALLALSGFGLLVRRRRP